VPIHLQKGVETESPEHIGRLDVTFWLGLLLDCEPSCV
jgi:hypothetical protein